MWVLSTARAELYHFSDCATVPGGYAILSHVWSPRGEQMFQDVQEITEQCKLTGDNPRDHVGEKIRRCCEIAERDGYDWVWIDSCCVDKTRSVELSELVNILFHWFTFAEVCYVYLEDVPHDDDPHAKDSRFRMAQWHTRGWMLQELLAPAFEIFLSREWGKIGTKYDLRVPLSECTGINVEYLTRELDFRVDASIAKRMSWAAGRKTARIEDEAYSLLGLFNVNMPIMYGEGQQAFQRLQMELVKQSTDATLFAWGPCHHPRDDEHYQVPVSRVHSDYHGASYPFIYLFAPSPSYFIGCSDTYYPRASTEASLPASPHSELFGKTGHDVTDGLLGQSHEEIPSFEMTLYGMKCHFPVAEVGGVSIAVLPCRKNAEHIGLLLHPAPNDEIQDRSRQLYYVSWGFRHPTASGYQPRRLAFLGGDSNNLCFRGQLFTAAWRDLYIIIHPAVIGRRRNTHLLQRFLPDVAPTPFRIPRILLQTLGALGFVPTSGMVSWNPASKDTMSFLCQNTELGELFHILLGTCTKAPTEVNPCHWASVGQSNTDIWAGSSCLEYVHDCTKDHIEDWPNRTREFGDRERTIRLVFAPCMHAPDLTLVLGLGLVGSVYEAIQQNANIYLQLPPFHFPQVHLNTVVAGTGDTSDLGSSTPPSAHSFLHRFTSVFKHSATSYRISRRETAHHSRKLKSIHTLTQSLHTVPPTLSNANSTSPIETRSAIIDGDTPSSLREEIEELRESNAARYLQMREAHDAQTRKLNEALTEITQLKALFAQISQNNGAAVPASASP